MNKPLLKQFRSLELADFEKYPVWVNCHVIDYDEPWYDETDEESFRPWAGNTPVDPNSAMFLVKSTFVLADGTVLDGFITPASDTNSDTAKVLGVIQPCIFTPSGKVIQFWFGSTPFSDEDLKNIYCSLERASKVLFPIKFEAAPGLAKGIISGAIHGFYYIEKNGVIAIKR
jgi:hypothetical protein